MEVKEEFMEIIRQAWTKLQGLPQACALDQGAFSILILFIATVLFLILIACIHSCCWKQKYQGSRVQPLSTV